jgi:hypothetical protein
MPAGPTNGGRVECVNGGGTASVANQLAAAGRGQTVSSGVDTPYQTNYCAMS